MSTRKMRSPFGRRSIAFVAFAVVVAMAGLVYAHWWTSLHVDANINTGNVGIEWVGAWTNDDGVPEYAEDPDNGFPGIFSYWGDGSSSVDPADFGEERYDKDVARCWVDGGGGHISINIENGYPSYHCLATSVIRNTGSVPIKALLSQMNMVRGYWECDWYFYDPLTGEQLGGPLGNIEHAEFGPYTENGEAGSGYEAGVDFRIWWYDDGFYWLDENDNGEYDEGETTLIDDCYFVGEELAMEEIDGSLGWGHYNELDEFVPEITGFVPELFGCGTQIDPGYEEAVDFGFHIEQPAEQGSGYVFSMHQEFVNWNEFDDGWCEPRETIRVWSSQLSFSSTGWGGWSCPATHPDAVNAGVSKVSGDEVAPDHPIEARVAEPGMPTFDGFDYPTFPHHVYPGGEEGVAAHNGGTGQSAYLWVDCMEE